MNRNLFVRPGLAGLLVLSAVLAVPAQDPAEEAKQLAQKAQEAAQSKQFEQAVGLMKKAIQLAPRNDLYLAQASDFELKAGNFSDGLEHALQAIKLNDKVGAYYILAGANAFSNQDLDRAREYCEVVLKRGPKEFGAAACKDAQTLLDLLVKKTYTLFWNLDPDKGRQGNGGFAIAMPKSGLPYQTVTYEITGAKSHRLVKSDVNDILYVVPQGNKPMALTTKITVEPYSFKQQLARATATTIPPEVRVYLGPSYSINPRSPALLKAVSGLKGKNTVETARNILTWMKKNVEYKLEKTPIDQLDFTTVEELIQRGHAECRGYAMLFTALCRAADIPARPIWGLVRVSANQDQRYGDIASHNWSEFYVPGCGWVPVDPQRPETLGCLPNRCIRIFMDAKKTKTSPENLPQLNLVSMNGDKLKFEERR